MQNEELANTPVSSFCLLPSAFVSAGRRAAWQAVPDCRRNKPRGCRGERMISVWWQGRALRVLADRQVSPTVLSSSLFRHAAILRGKFGGVNSAFISSRRGRQRAAFPVPSVGSRRKSASRRRAEAALWRAAKAEGLAQSKTFREVRRPLANAPASWTVHPPSRNAGLRRTGGGPPPLSIQGIANRFSPGRFRGRRRSSFGLLNLMGCSPHSFLRVQKIQFPEGS